jgi:cyclase
MNPRLLQASVLMLAGMTAEAQDVLTGAELFENRGVDLTAIEITTETVAPGLHVLLGAGGNLAVSIGAQGVLLVDDQFPALVPKIRDAIRELGGGAVDFVVNTHWHFDHSDGNAMFAGDGSWIVAQSNSRQMMTERRLINQIAFQVEQPASKPEALPVITFDNGMQLHFNGEKIDILHFGPAHTTGDAAVIFRGRNVVHMGDVYNTAGYPFIDADNGGTLDGIIYFCEAVLDEIANDTVVIPGHGAVGNYADLVDYTMMLRTIRDRMTALIAEGASLDEIIAAKPTAEWDEVKGDPARLLNRAYAGMTQ